MKYPENERLLITRPCLKAICLNVKSAARLLSHLLYLARNCDEQACDFTISCTQQEIIEGLIDEIDVKTLHRTAIPMLRLLGFLDVDGSSYRYQYTVHLDLIQHCILHAKNKEQLDKILIVSMKEQLDKILMQIDKSPIELVKCPIELDKCLIPFRQMSNSKRGRKPSPVVHSEAISEDRRFKRDITDNKENTKREGVAVAPPTPSQPSSSEIDEETKKRPATKVAANKNLQPPHPDKSQTNGTAFPVPKRARPQSNIMDTLPSEEARRIMDDWDSIFSRPCTRTENHIKAAELLVPCHPTKDDLSDIRKFCYSSNPKWYRDKGVSLQDVAKNFDKWQSHREAPKPEKEPSNEHRVSSFGTPGYNFADEFYPSEAEKKAYYAAHPQGVKS